MVGVQLFMLKQGYSPIFMRRSQAELRISIFTHNEYMNNFLNKCKKF
jgi:hypothetical protein